MAAIFYCLTITNTCNILHFFDDNKPASHYTVTLKKLANRLRQDADKINKRQIRGK